MPPTRARGGFGTRLQADDGSGAFVTIAECMDISGPELTSVIEDATNQDSPGGWAEKIPTGLKEAGDVTFQCNLIDPDATQLRLVADLKAQTVRNYRILHPSQNRRVSFTGMVARVGDQYPVRNKMVRDVTITVTGEPFLENHP